MLDMVPCMVTTIFQVHKDQEIHAAIDQVTRSELLNALKILTISSIMKTTNLLIAMLTMSTNMTLVTKSRNILMLSLFLHVFLP